MLLVTVLGISGALIFGAADFIGGLASRRVSPLIVTALSAAGSFGILLLAYSFVGGTWSTSAIIWGGLSGVSSAIAIALLYACLAIGPMSILSPLTAVVSAIVPMTAGLIGGTRLEIWGYAGLGLALVAVVLVGFVPEKGAVRPSLRGVLMAIGSGAMIGVFLILIDQTPDDSGVAPLIANRLVNVTVLVVTLGVLTVIARRTRAKNPTAQAERETGSRNVRFAVLLALVCGVVDAVANILLLTGIHLGELTIVSVLTALYPAGTILLAAIVLRERVAPVQIVGLVLALIAAGMLALA